MARKLCNSLSVGFWVAAIFWSTGLLSGCSRALRFAPTEAQKQTAEVTYGLAAKIHAEGTPPGSTASRQVKTGTRASLIYAGRPKEPVEIEQFDTVAAQATQDATKRPDANDVFAAVEQGLSLTSQLLIAFGLGGAGFGGKKAVDWIRLAKEKSTALEEVVKGNEVFMRTGSEVKQALKEAQGRQSPATRVLVTKIRAE